MSPRGARTFTSTCRSSTTSKGSTTRRTRRATVMPAPPVQRLIRNGRTRSPSPVEGDHHRPATSQELDLRGATGVHRFTERLHRGRGAVNANDDVTSAYRRPRLIGLEDQQTARASVTEVRLELIAHDGDAQTAETLSPVIDLALVIAATTPAGLHPAPALHLRQLEATLQLGDVELRLGERVADLSGFIGNQPVQRGLRLAQRGDDVQQLRPLLACAGVDLLDGNPDGDRANARSVEDPHADGVAWT